MKVKIIFALSLFFSISFLIKAQYIEDAMRFVSPNSPLSVRTAALGGSYFGFSDDGSALLTNPAGITLIPAAELGLGINLTNHKIVTNFLGNKQNEQTNEFYFTNVNFIFPSLNNYDVEVENERNFNFKVGFDYHIENDFTLNTAYSGFNLYNTLTANQAYYRQEWVDALMLADSNWNSRAPDNLYQDGFVYEDGGLHNFSFGFGMDVNQTFAFGGTFSLKFGTYEYKRQYFETDKDNIHNTPITDDIDQLSVVQNLTQDLIGLSGIVGFQARLSQYCRLGLAIKFPTLLSDSEYFAARYEVRYDLSEEGGIPEIYDHSTGTLTNVYDVITPFEFTAGLSGNVFGLSYSVSGSVLNAASTYFDVPEENWELDYSDLLYFDELNELMEANLTMQYTIGVGLEYKIPATPLYLRGSYTLQTSPYKDKSLCSNKNMIGTGIGLVVTENMIIDAAFVYVTQDYRRANYGDDSLPQLSSFYNVKHNPTSFMLGFRYRF